MIFSTCTCDCLITNGVWSSASILISSINFDKTSLSYNKLWSCYTGMLCLVGIKLKTSTAFTTGIKSMLSLSPRNITRALSLAGSVQYMLVLNSFIFSLSNAFRSLSATASYENPRITHFCVSLYKAWDPVIKLVKLPPFIILKIMSASEISQFSKVWARNSFSLILPAFLNSYYEQESVRKRKKRTISDVTAYVPSLSKPFVPHTLLLKSMT